MPGKWTKFKKSVGFNASTMLLLTDATVLVHDAGAAAVGTPNWYKLTPDAKGNYARRRLVRDDTGPEFAAIFRVGCPARRAGFPSGRRVQRQHHTSGAAGRGDLRSRGQHLERLVDAGGMDHHR